MIYRPSCVALILVAVMGFASAPAGCSGSGSDVGGASAVDAVTFTAMGDVPYAENEYDLLAEHIAAIGEKDAFVIHLGDIKRGKEPCEAGVYTRVAGVLRKSRQPVFIIPGDNEYNDCQEPDKAWKLWSQHFMQFDAKWPKAVAEVQRQASRPEHFAFVFKGVLFVGVHVVGGRVHDADEWQQRMTAAVTWLRTQITKHGESVRATVVFGHATQTKNHAVFFEGLNAIAEQWKKPMLYLHGDGHTWKHDRPFKAKNILRVQVDQGGKAPPVRVTVGSDPEKAFQFDRGSKE